jgi:ABC-2 type transport system permease protein
MFNKLKKMFFNEAKIIAADHSILLTVIIAPLLYAFFLGSIYIYKDESKVKFGVVDMDRTVASRSIITALNSTEKIDLINEGDNFNTAVERVHKMEINGFIFIPHNFEKNLKKLKGGDVSIFLNTTKFLPSNDVNKAVTKVLLMAGAGIRLKYFQAVKGMSEKQALTQVMPLTPNVHMLYNPTANYGDFLLPGIFLLILHQTLFLGLGESIALIREKMKFKQWVTDSAKNIWIMINGKVSFYLFLFAAITLFFYTVVFPLFDVRFGGNPFLIALLTLFFLLSVLYYTVFFASFFKTQSGIMEVFAFTSYPIFLTTGYSWPIDSFPLLLQLLSKFIPLTPYYSSIIRITQMNAGFQYVWGDLLHLIWLSGFAYLLAHFRMKYLIKKLVDTK